MSINDITSRVHELRELMTMQEQLNSEIETLKDSLKAELDERQTEELNGTDWKITYKSITSTRLDNIALKKELPEIYARYSKDTTCKRFTVK